MRISLLYKIKSLILHGSLGRAVRACTFTEKILVFSLFLIVVLSLSYWGNALFVRFTVPGPSTGGLYTEAVFGTPAYFNPLLLAGSDAEGSVVELVYGSLFRADGRGGLQPDLAERFEVSPDRKTYTVYLRRDVKWHDGEDFTADDAVFTFRLAQNPLYPVSAFLREAFSGVKIEKVDDYTVKFVLDKPYAQFLSQLRTGILPEHLWGNVAPEAFARSELNLQPIGTGPFVFEKTVSDEETGKITQATLRRFDAYHAPGAYIDRITLYFYDDERSLSQALRDRLVTGAAILPRDYSDIAEQENTVVHRLLTPKYFAVFFNRLKSPALGYAEVRRALALAVDRREMVEGVFFDQAVALKSPLLPGMIGYRQDSRWPDFDPEKAKELLEARGWKAGEDGIRAKDGTVLRFELVVPDWEDLVKVAEILRRQWREIGADVLIVKASSSEIKTKYLGKERPYDAILYGQTYFSFDPAPFSFWHSSQKSAKNFAQFSSSEADDILRRAQAADEEKRAELYRRFDDLLAEDIPAVMLFGQYYLYAQDKQVRGFEGKILNTPAERFSSADRWYMRTKRVFPRE